MFDIGSSKIYEKMIHYSIQTEIESCHDTALSQRERDAIAAGQVKAANPKERLLGHDSLHMHEIKVVEMSLYPDTMSLLQLWQCWRVSFFNAG
jgi:hypothetical protein